VSKHPVATFVSKEVKAKEDDRLEIVGDLTLHGVTRSITINAKKVGEGKDPWGGYRAGFKGKTEFRMKDFGIDYDLGPASEVVYLDLHIEGVKQ
jgi:polyisoprenoid-binding protein YceI